MLFFSKFYFRMYALFAEILAVYNLWTEHFGNCEILNHPTTLKCGFRHQSEISSWQSLEHQHRHSSSVTATHAGNTSTAIIISLGSIRPQIMPSARSKTHCYRVSPISSNINKFVYWKKVDSTVALEYFISDWFFHSHFQAGSFNFVSGPAKGSCIRHTAGWWFIFKQFLYAPVITQWQRPGAVKNKFPKKHW